MLFRGARDTVEPGTYTRGLGTGCPELALACSSLRHGVGVEVMLSLLRPASVLL